jgi:DNA/RNA-binding domain of Phe-tRNA-synthetase-like protein
MSVTTNIVAKFKQLFYNAGDNSNAVSDAVEQFNDFFIAVQVPAEPAGNAYAAAANGSVALTVPYNAKLVGCNICTTPAVTNATGDDIVITVTTNGATAATYNSNASAQGAISANSVGAFSVNTVNSFIDAGEVCKLAYTMADNTNNYLNGVVTITFRRQ